MGTQEPAGTGRFCRSGVQDFEGGGFLASPAPSGPFNRRDGTISRSCARNCRHRSFRRFRDRLLIQGALLYTGMGLPLEITSLADIPAEGSGLGSSSALCVGLLHALTVLGLKKQFAEGISNSPIDEAQEAATAAGALGGKVGRRRFPAFLRAAGASSCSVRSAFRASPGRVLIRPAVHENYPCRLLRGLTRGYNH